MEGAHEKIEEKGSTVLSKVGNAVLYGGLATSGLLAYYQFNYTATELDKMVQETKEEGNSSAITTSVRLKCACASHRKFFLCILIVNFMIGLTLLIVVSPDLVANDGMVCKTAELFRIRDEKVCRPTLR